MAVQTPGFVPTLWSTKILRVLEDNLVAMKICSTEMEGEIKKAGDTVRFSGLSDPTISNYSGTVSYETLKDASVELKIDQQKYFAFKVDDIDKAQANIDEKGSQASRAAFLMRETLDTYVMGKYTDCNLSVTGTITTANVLSKFAEISQALQQVNVPESDTFVIIPPWLRIKLQLAGIKFLINEGINGTGGMAWTKELGFDVYVTNQVVNTGTVPVPISQVMAGRYNSIVFAHQVTETESLRLEGQFADAVRGLDVFGAKMIRPDLMVQAAFTYGAETTI